MKAFAAVMLLAIALGGFGCRKPEKMPAAQPRLSATEEFNLRGKCAALGDEMTATYGIVGDALISDMVTHYNPETNRCYVEFTATKNFAFKYPSTPENYRTVAVYDGQTKEMLVYADQEGDKSNGIIWTRQAVNDRYTSFEKAQAEIDLLMQVGSRE